MPLPPFTAAPLRVALPALVAALEHAFRALALAAFSTFAAPAFAL